MTLSNIYNGVFCKNNLVRKLLEILKVVCFEEHLLPTATRISSLQRVLSHVLKVFYQADFNSVLC